MKANQAPATRRVTLTLATRAGDFVRGRSGPGGVFAGDTHAFEVACYRLVGMREFVRRQCRQFRVPFSESAFWDLFLDLRLRATPKAVGRPWAGVGIERSNYWMSASPAIQNLFAELVEAGHFQNPSHVVETGLLLLMGCEQPGELAGETAFPFNREKTWADYRALAARPRERDAT